MILSRRITVYLTTLVRHFQPWFLLVLLLSNQAWADDGMPGRALYPAVKPIELGRLYALRPNVTIVDVRSRYEYETLHIKDAVNIVFGGQGFIEAIRKLRAESAKPIAFYCNGRTCEKSYQAAMEAQNGGVDNVYAFDAGAFEWTEAHPEEAVLLGQSPVDKTKLISSKKLAAHSLSPKEFERRIDKDTLLIDVQDTFQQEGISLFHVQQESVPLDNKALQKYINQAKAQNKTLLIYDATGNQVRWLQYYLEGQKVSSYYFMQGGAKAYYKMMMSEILR